LFFFYFFYPTLAVSNYSNKNKYMQISNTAIELIRGNNKIMGRLMIAFNRGQKSIETWLDNKDIRLTTPTAVQIIEEGTELSADQILVAEDKDTTLAA